METKYHALDLEYGPRVKGLLKTKGTGFFTQDQGYGFFFSRPFALKSLFFVGGLSLDNLTLQS